MSRVARVLAAAVAAAALGGCAGLLLPPPQPEQIIVICRMTYVKGRYIETCSGPNGGYFIYQKK